jgi:hypothetical protein
MGPQEREAFEKSYRNNVAVATPEELTAFLDEYLAKHSRTVEEMLYQKYSSYTSIVDSLCIWAEASKYTTQMVLADLAKNDSKTS